MLGVLPGAGGTQRLVKLVGEDTAFPMILTGAAKDAKKAKKMGLIDQTIEPLGPGKVTTMEYLENCSINYAKQLANGSLKSKTKKPKTQTKIAEVLEKSAAAGFGTPEAFDAEAQGFGELTMEPVTKAMINIFNARTHCQKNRWGKPERPVQ